MREKNKNSQLTTYSQNFRGKFKIIHVYYITYKCSSFFILTNLKLYFRVVNLRARILIDCFANKPSQRNKQTKRLK